MDKPYLLVGDVGGTNTRLALAYPSGTGYRLEDYTVYRTRQLSGLPEAVDRFFSGLSLEPRPAGCCISAAGPVESGVSTLTNAPWKVNEHELADMLGCPSRVINDFAALSYGLAALDVEDAESVVPIAHADGSFGTPRGNVRAVVGPGTGLGVGYLVHHEGKYLGLPSEAGHSDFAPYDETSLGMFGYLKERYGVDPGSELAVSGQGIANWFDYLFETANRPASCRDIAELPDSEKPAAVASRADDDPLCGRVLDNFFAAFGRFAANVCLHYLPTAGLFLAGGIPAKHRTRLAASGFAAGFDTNYRDHIRRLLVSTPLYLVVREHTALQGAALVIHQEIPTTD